MNENANSSKILTTQFLLVFAVLFFTSLVMYALMSPITVHASKMGLTPFMAGLASGIYVIGGLLSLMYAGHALKSWGWKKTAYVFLGIHLFACFFYFIASDAYTLLFARFIHGIGMGGSGAAIITIAAPLFPKDRFGEAMGLFLAGTPLAVGIGPYLGTYVYYMYGSNLCFVVSTLFAAIALFAMFFVEIKETHDEKIRDKKYEGIRKVIEPEAVPISIIASIASVSYVAVISFSAPYSSQLNLVHEFEYFFLLYSIVLLISRPMGGKIQDKLGDWLVIIVPMVIQTIGAFLIALYPSVTTLLISAVCYGAGFGTFYSVANSIVARDAPEDRKPYAISTYLLILDTVMGFSPAILGLFAINGNYTWMFTVSAIVTACSIPIALFYRK